MAQIRLNTFHIFLINAVLFSISLVAFKFLSFEAAVGVLTGVFLIAFVIWWWQQKAQQEDRRERIAVLRDKTNMNLTTLLNHMPLGVVTIDSNSQMVDWYNPYVELFFTTEKGELEESFTQEVLALITAEEPQKTLVYDKKTYTLQIDQSKEVIYIADITGETNARRDLIDHQVAIGIISVDNYDDLEDAIDDNHLSQVNAFISEFIAQFTENYNIYYRKINSDRFYIVTDYTTLESLMANQFEALETFRENVKALELPLPLALSIGISYGSNDYRRIGGEALQNLTMAEVRGGDQAVVKRADDSQQPQFFGGGTEATNKRTRTRTRAMISAISDRIKAAETVLIAGHRNMDLDALGAAVGMQYFASGLVDNSFVVYDETDMSKDIASGIQQLKEQETGQLITVSEAIKKAQQGALLIMVDHSKTTLTLSDELYQDSQTVLVIDHHRRDTDFPESALLSYIESRASSASELVAELIQLRDGEKSKLTRLQASLLMAGIVLDTHNFTKRVTSRTFEVASFLQDRGSSSRDIQQVLATDFEDYKAINELILRGRLFREDIMLITGSEDICYDTVIPSKAADIALDMSGISAVFVITRHEKGYVSVSARSKDDKNVQRVMEKMGGGGHFHMAACQIEDARIVSVTNEIERYIAEELD